jgi:hypothetical protein
MSLILNSVFSCPRWSVWLKHLLEMFPHYCERAGCSVFNVSVRDNLNLESLLHTNRGHSVRRLTASRTSPRTSRWVSIMSQILPLKTIASHSQRMIYVGFGSTALIDTINAIVVSHLLFKTSPPNHQRCSLHLEQGIEATTQFLGFLGSRVEESSASSSCSLLAQECWQRASTVLLSQLWHREWFLLLIPGPSI